MGCTWILNLPVQSAISCFPYNIVGTGDPARIRWYKAYWMQYIIRMTGLRDPVISGVRSFYYCAFISDCPACIWIYEIQFFQMTGSVALLPDPVQSSVCSFQYHTADTCCPSGHWRYKTNDIDYIRSIGIDPCPVASPVCTFENDGVLCNSISCIFICKKNWLITSTAGKRVLPLPIAFGNLRECRSDIRLCYKGGF